MKMFDVVALGELLVDFTYHGKSENGMRLFEQNPGGAPANVLCALANLGLSVAFIGKVGKDMHGEFLRAVLQEKHVDTSGLVLTEDAFTTLAFVELSESGERKFSFARKPGADTCLTQAELSYKLLEACKIFHFGSLSLTNEPMRSTTLEAVRTAKHAGAVVSYDPNYRAPLWQSEAEAVANMRSVLESVDIIKISEEEIGLLTGCHTLEAAADALLQKGVSCVVITLGEKGAYAKTKSACANVPVPNVPVVDTTGAGDAFWGGFLYQLATSGLAPAKLDAAELGRFLAFANAVASLCVQKRGGIPAMPDEQAVLQFLA